MSPSAADLIAAARAGDRAALERLLADEQRRIYAFGMKMCRNPEDASDVLQETMLAVAKGIGGFRGDASLSTWLFQIARSFCLKKRRKKKGEPTHTDLLVDVPDARLADAGAAPDDLAAQSELKAAVDEALATLPLEAREVLVLRDVEGLTAPEVADVLGVSVAAVKSRLHRARGALEGALSPRFGAQVPARSDCPHVTAMLSKKLEGELTSSLCTELEHHVADCAHCRSACDLLKQSLAACRDLPAVPDDVKQSAQRALDGLTPPQPPSLRRSRAPRP